MIDETPEEQKAVRHQAKIARHLGRIADALERAHPPLIYRVNATNQLFTLLEQIVRREPPSHAALADLANACLLALGHPAAALPSEPEAT